MNDDVLNKLPPLHYLMNYNRHYKELLALKNVERRKDQIISELILFRQWFIQFFFRIFTDEETGENVIQNILNETDGLGKGIIKKVDNVDIEKSLGYSYIELVNNRWTEYDNVFIVNRDKHHMPYDKILEKLIIILKLDHLPIGDSFLARNILNADLLNLQNQLRNILKVDI